jgi:hypothetical protein
LDIAAVGAFIAEDAVEEQGVRRPRQTPIKGDRLPLTFPGKGSPVSVKKTCAGVVRWVDVDAFDLAGIVGGAGP